MCQLCTIARNFATQPDRTQQASLVFDLRQFTTIATIKEVKLKEQPLVEDNKISREARKDQC
jgi:hypothetical protein